MQISSGVVKQLRFLSTRILLCAAAVAIYLILWRPARVFVAEQVVYPQIEIVSGQENGFDYRLESGALLIRYELGNGTKQLQYRPQFGFFFLIAFMALLFVTDHPKPYLTLVVLHLIATFLVYLLITAGASGFQPAFMLADALSGYLIPALSLGLVPLVANGFL